MRVCGAKRVHFCVCAVLSGCTSAGVLTIWHASVQRKAGALQRVFLPFGTRVCAVLIGCNAGGVLTIWHACVWRKASALQRVFLPFGSAKRVHFCVCAVLSGCTSVFLPFGMRVCSAERMHLSGCSYHLACECAAQSRCASAGVLTIWHACVCSAERMQCRGCSYHLACVCAAQSGCTSAGILPFGMRVCSAQRIHLSGCCYTIWHACAVLSGCTSAGVLAIWPACVQRKAGALQRVLLLFGMPACSAERVHFSGCSYHLACMCAAQSGCPSAGVLTIRHACVHR